MRTNPIGSMTPRAFLSCRPLDFGHQLDQEGGVAWMKAALVRAAETDDTIDAHRASRYYDIVSRRSSIQSRRSAIDDYLHRDWGAMQLHRPATGEDGLPAPWYQAPLDRRMALFCETAEAVARDAFADDETPPDIAFQVSCTGYDSPSAVQRALADRGWSDHVRVLTVGHMGCYAALPALATAADVVMAEAARQPDGRANAVIVDVEFCTLHHYPATTDPEQIVQQCLFADGAVRIDVGSSPDGADFALLDHLEAILPDTLGEMTWRPASDGFRMTLSRAVPDHIRKNVAGVIEGFLGAHGLAVGDVDVWAIHPGGPRVIESTAAALGVDDAVRARHSHDVLRERGNMSSTTLPHIWDRIAEDDETPAGALICSIAFGPGLTVVANLLRKL